VVKERSPNTARVRGPVGVSPSGNDRHRVAQRSSPRYGCGATSRTRQPSSAAVTAAETAAIVPPTTMTSASRQTGRSRADSTTAGPGVLSISALRTEGMAAPVQIVNIGDGREYVLAHTVMP
jgi:hypothetical protein